MRAALEKLLTEEKFFVEEIHRLAFEAEKVSFFPSDLFQNSTDGWVYQAGEDNSADWNLARLIGSAEISRKLADLMPQKELQLLVKPEFIFHFDDFVPVGNILWLESSEQPGKGLVGNPEYEFAEKFGLKLIEKRKKRSNDHFACEGISLVLLRENMVAGVIKTIRETPGFIEVYIEIAPDLRGQGIGTLLLTSMVEKVHSLGKKLIYSVDSDNTSSRAIALKAGLKKYFVLSRLVRKPL